MLCVHVYSLYMFIETFYLVYYSRWLFLFSDYLLSNNSVNSIIIHKFDFSDEEVKILFCFVFFLILFLLLL